MSEEEFEDPKQTILLRPVNQAGKPVFLDATAGQVLDERLVKKARLVEMQYIENKSVYTKVPTENAFRLTGRAPIAVKWLDAKGVSISIPRASNWLAD